MEGCECDIKIRKNKAEIVRYKVIIMKNNVATVK